MITRSALHLVRDTTESIRMGELIDRHERWLIASGRSPRTVDSRVKILTIFARHLDKPFGEATEDDIIAFLINPDWALGTRRTYHANIGAFYDWMQQHELVEKNPCRYIPKARLQHRPPRPVSNEDFHAAIAGATPRTRVWLILARYNGLRAVEVAALKPEHINLDTGQITIHGKGGRVAVQKLTAPSYVAIRQWLEEHGTTWETNATQVSQAGNYALRNAGSKSTYHACRHAFAMELYDRFRDQALVQKALRHASPSATAIYAQTRDSQLAEAYDEAWGDYDQAWRQTVDLLAS